MAAGHWRQHELWDGTYTLDDLLDIVELIDTVLTSANAHFAALTAKEPSEEQLAERAAHGKVLKDVVRKVNMMTAGRPLNRY